MLADAGLALRSAGDRVLTARLGDDFEALFVRAQDIPEFVADGAADAGVTGWDLVSESGRELESLLDLGFGACRVVVAVREESPVSSIEGLAPGARVATVFPGITRRYFTERGIPIELVPMSGAVEVAPHLGIADVVVDITSTGSTLKTNGLREVATVMRSTAHVVARPGGAGPSELGELVAALESVLRARGKRYLMANVPRRALDRVREIVPGLNGPTVIDIMDGGVFVAVHAVVPAAAIYKTIAALKSLGAEGILVTRIERLMP